MTATSRASTSRQKALVGLSKFFFPSLAIDDTEYSYNGWAYGSVSIGDHRQAAILFVLYYRF